MVDYERSLAIAQQLDYLYTPGCCWANAVQALRMKRFHLSNAIYVEGWCAMPGIGLVQPHGWIELQDGTILDPTYMMADHEQGQRNLYVYFPALHYKLEELKGVRLRSLPRIWRTGGFEGLRNEAYREAMENAYRCVGRAYPIAQRGLQNSE